MSFRLNRLLPSGDHVSIRSDGPDGLGEHLIYYDQTVRGAGSAIHTRHRIEIDDDDLRALSDALVAYLAKAP